MSGITHDIFCSHLYDNMYRMRLQVVSLPVYNHRDGKNNYQRQENNNDENCNWNTW